MKKTYFTLIKITVLCLSILGFAGTKAFAEEAETHTIQSVVAKEFAWASKPGDNNETLKLGQEVQVSLYYLDKFGRKEIDFIFYDQSGGRLDMTKYRIYINNSGVVGTSTTPTEHKKQGHMNLPILGAGTTSVYLEDNTRIETTVRVATINVTATQTMTSANGLPMNYNTPYYIFNDKLKGKRGGLTFEPYSNVDRILYSNSVTVKVQQ